MAFPHPLIMIPLRHCGGYEFLSFKNEKRDLEGVVTSLDHFPTVICNHLS